MRRKINFLLASVDIRDNLANLKKKKKSKMRRYQCDNENDNNEEKESKQRKNVFHTFYLIIVKFHNVIQKYFDISLRVFPM